MILCPWKLHSKLASGGHLKTKKCVQLQWGSKGNITLQLPYQSPLVRDTAGQGAGAFELYAKLHRCVFFFWKKSWLFYCLASSFFIIYLYCHTHVQNQLTSTHWGYNICKALQYWLLWRWVEVTHSENANWHCKNTDVDVTALSSTISIYFTFLPLIASLSTKTNRKKCPGSYFGGARR